MNDNMPSIEIDEESDETLFEEEPENSDVSNLIATFFVQTSNNRILKEEPIYFDFPPANFVNSGADEGHIWDKMPGPVFQLRIPEEKRKKYTEQSFRQFPSMTGMNTLMRKSFIMDTADANTTGPTFLPTGTVESIIGFGLSRNLDLDQQTAFEILTSTFVLTYV